VTPALRPAVGDAVEVLDELYDPRWAEPWDAVGLVTGDLDRPVRRVLLAVDPVQAVIDEAVTWGADLLVTHHPLLLRGVHGVATTTPKGRAVTSLVRNDVALLVAHTNADVAEPGVSDALAATLGVVETTPLRPSSPAPTFKLVTFVPHDDAQRLIDALAAAGAGSIGGYERCAWTTEGTGTFRGGEGTSPTVGQRGRTESVSETRVEMVVPAAAKRAVLSALLAVHPYEEPAFDFLVTAPSPGARGTGRVGRLAAPVSVADFGRTVQQALPPTSAGVRVAGDPDSPVTTVAVCGGAGDDLFDEVRASGADVYVTADLRHHPASEALEHGRPALVDCAHWATEWPWLHEAERRLLAGLGTRPGGSDSVETRVSQVVTDPWTTLFAADSRSPH
jgi:dinuclear metal center YbgI/SA1388 family protein